MFSERELRAFLAVAELGSTARAAQAVHRTQPSLSRQIHELELRLNAPLFERHSKGMSLTLAGELFLKHAQLIVFEMDRAAEAVMELRGLRRGRLNLGAVGTLARSIVPRALAEFSRQAPDIAIEVFEAPGDELVIALADRRIDLMLAEAGLEDEDVEALAECRVDDQYVPIASAIHGPSGALDLDMLLKGTWVMLPRGRGPRHRFEEVMARAGQPTPRISIETNSIGAQIAIVAASTMFGWLPSTLIADHVEAGRVRVHALPELTLSRRFQIYRRRRSVVTAPAELFVELL